jgi:hypothetical protein
MLLKTYKYLSWGHRCKLNRNRRKRFKIYRGIRLHFLQGIYCVSMVTNIVWAFQHFFSSMSVISLEWTYIAFPPKKYNKTSSSKRMSKTRKDWMIYRGPSFLAVVYDLAPRPTPSHLFSNCLSFSVVGPAYWQERGRGRAWSRIIRPQESLALYQSFNPLW